MSQHTHLSDDAEASLVQGCRATCMSETTFQGFFFQLPLSCRLVVGLMNLMSMTLKQYRTNRHGYCMQTGTNVHFHYKYIKQFQCVNHTG